MVGDIETLAKQKIESTTKEALINARLGQGRFRSEVLQFWGHTCAVTGATTAVAIRASHIKPWCDSTNKERLDPNNGLPLVASLDALFDAGLISFEASGKLVVSSKLTQTERDILGIGQAASLKLKPTTITARYLAFHRSKHGFRK